MKSLILIEITEVLHRQMVLCPVLEHLSVATVGHQLVGELGNTMVQVVHDHELHGRTKDGFGWVCRDGVGFYHVGGTESLCEGKEGRDGVERVEGLWKGGIRVLWGERCSRACRCGQSHQARG